MPFATSYAVALQGSLGHLIEVQADVVGEDSILPDLARATALVVLYVVSGRIGLALAHEQDNATLFWPPTGLAIAALLLLGPRFAPA